MANVFGGGSKGSSGISTSTTTQTSGSNVGPSVLKQCNTGGGGATTILSTSPDALQASEAQVFASSPNNYSKIGSEYPTTNLRDYYNKADIHRLLKTKADISSVYTEAEVDSKLLALKTEIDISLTQFITEQEVDEKITESFDSITSLLESNYYEKQVLYTKSEINTLLSQLELGDEFVSLQPQTTARNIINPGVNNATSLTLVASSNSNATTIQHWIDDQSNSVGRIRKSGRVEFYGHMVLGENIESWRPALDANIRRISGVADPIHRLDATNKKYVEDFVINAISNAQIGADGIYDVDCLTY
jgi:hypothetical protein